MKICSKCKQEKPLEMFYPDKKNKKDGLMYYCKECAKKSSSFWAKNNPEKIKKIAKKCRNNRDVIISDYYKEKNREAQNRWRERNPDKSKQLFKQWYDKNKESEKVRRKKWKESNKEKTNAHEVVRRKLKNPGICEICKSDRFVDAHHFDYNYPLEVMYLCRSCHKRMHLALEWNRKQIASLVA